MYDKSVMRLLKAIDTSKCGDQNRAHQLSLDSLRQARVVSQLQGDVWSEHCSERGKSVRSIVL